MIPRLSIALEGAMVGELAQGPGGQISFQYVDTWLAHGFSLSPLHLPFDAAVHHTDSLHFDGLYGVFADSLPDGWGLLLMDLYFRTRGVLREEITPLDRLAYIGDRAMGALTYQPATPQSAPSEIADLSALAESARAIIHGETEDVLEQLRVVGGSPGGARPKVAVAFSDDGQQCIAGQDSLPPGYAHWLVKFRSSDDESCAGAIEKAYADMAHAAGVIMPETRLLSVGRKRFFAVRRFDRAGTGPKFRRIHTLTLAGLIHANFRAPAVDYDALLGATGYLTQDRQEIAKAFRLAAFNVLTGNRDDHARNFSFIRDQRWLLSPAYDLTFSQGMGGEHSTSVMGQGKPTRRDLEKLAAKHGIKAQAIIDEVRSALAQWPKIAAGLDIPATRIEQYRLRLQAIDRQVQGKNRQL